MLPQTARKTADTQRQSTTTQTLDPHLQFTVVPNAVYTFEGWFAYDSDNAADLIMAWTLPSGTQGKWVGLGTGTTVISGTAGGGTQQNAVSTWGYTLRNEFTDINAGRTYGGLGVGNPQSVVLMGTIRVGATGGTFGLQWAQAVSTAINTTIYTDSAITLQRTA
jgi:hypothetical protein